MAVCFFVVKPAVANPGSTLSPNMVLRTALVREAAGEGGGGRGGRGGGRSARVGYFSFHICM